MTKKDRAKIKGISAALIVVMVSVMTGKPNEFKEQHAVNETVVTRVSGLEESYG